MSESWIWWVVQVGLNILDFVMLYVISHALMKKYIVVKRQHVIFCIIYTVIVGIAGYLLDDFNTRIISQLILMTMIKFMIKRSDLSDLLIIYMFSFVIMGVVQTPIVVIIFLFNQLFEFVQPVILLIAQILTVSAVVPICKNFKWNKLFYAIHANVILKLTLFIFAFLILIVMFALNFEYYIVHLIFLTLGILLVGLAIFPIIVQLYRNAIDIISVYDLKNDLLSMSIAMKNMNDPEEIKQMYYEFANEFDVDVSKLDVSKAENELVYMESMNDSIKEFIKMKLDNGKRKFEVISDITYFEAHETVDFKTVLKWLGTLLDNAIDATDENPIHISLFSMDDEFTLKIANEYLGEEGKDIKSIFECGYSTKGDGRGIGLHNLHQAVTAQGGIVEVDEYYTEAYNCHYLQIELQFKRNETIKQ